MSMYEAWESSGECPYEYEDSGKNWFTGRTDVVPSLIRWLRLYLNLIMGILTGIKGEGLHVNVFSVEELMYDGSRVVYDDLA